MFKDNKFELAASVVFLVLVGLVILFPSFPYGERLWTFLNSPIGVSIVLFFWTTVAGRVFLQKPQWKKYVDQYRPLLVTVIKRVEKEIPDNTPHAGAARLDMALKYILMIHAQVDQEAMKQAITVVHAEVESGQVMKKVASQDSRPEAVRLYKEGE